MIKRMKNIRLRLLIIHIIITLAYPTVKAFTAHGSRLLIFTDAMTIVALILVVVGLLYSLVLHGDFDISSYFVQWGVKSVRRFLSRQSRDSEDKPDIGEFMRDAQEKREESFNYTLFLGIIYLLASIVIAHGILS